MVREGYLLFFAWGTQTPVIFEQPYKGGPTPLMANIAKEIYKTLSKISIVFFLVCVIEAVVIQTQLTR